MSIECVECGKECSYAVKVDAVGDLCGLCHMKLFPHTMDLVRNCSNNMLYNSSLGGKVEVIMTVRSFQDCGWFLREKEIRSGFIHYRLEYRGKVRCSRCDGAIWPDEIEKKCEHYEACHMCSFR